MSGLDIPFPESEYQIISTSRAFNLIYPIEHPLAKTISVDMMVRVVAMEDSDYRGFMKNEIKPQDISPIGGKLLEVGYLRDTALRNVTPEEWSTNYGPPTPRDFLKVAGHTNTDCYVKIINLKVPTYSLKLLNQRYGNPTRQKRDN